MGRAAISVGDDTPTGEPANGPTGPYITDMDDGTRPKRRKAGTQARAKDKSQAGAASRAGQGAPASPERPGEPALPDSLSKRPRGPAQP